MSIQGNDDRTKFDIHHVLLAETHLWHVRDEDRAKVLGDLNVVRCTHWLPAQVQEAKLCHRARTLRYHNFAAPGVQLAVRDGRV